MMDFEQDIAACLQVLNRGGLILYPTDTVWGIGCDATNAHAVSRIFTVKQRPQAKSLIVLVAEELQILRHVSQPDLQVFDFLRTVKKPTTVIYDGAIGLASNVVAEDGTVAIRLVREAFCRHLVKRFRKPLVSTSANISGAPVPGNFSAIDEKITSAVDYVVHFRQQETGVQEPSAIVRYNPDGTVTYIRS